MAQSQWLASLSDGSTVIEQWVPDSKSPWQTLVETIREKGLNITQLRLQIAGKTHTSVANASGYYQARQAQNTCGETQVVERHGIGCLVGGTLSILWVDTLTGDTHQEVRTGDAALRGVWRKT